MKQHLQEEEKQHSPVDDQTKATSTTHVIAGTDIQPTIETVVDPDESADSSIAAVQAQATALEDVQATTVTPKAAELPEPEEIGTAEDEGTVDTALIVEPADQVGEADAIAEGVVEAPSLTEFIAGLRSKYADAKKQPVADKSEQNEAPPEPVDMEGA